METYRVEIYHLKSKRWINYETDILHRAEAVEKAAHLDAAGRPSRVFQVHFDKYNNSSSSKLTYISARGKLLTEARSKKKGKMTEPFADLAEKPFSVRLGIVLALSFSMAGMLTVLTSTFFVYLPIHPSYLMLLSLAMFGLSFFMIFFSLFFLLKKSKLVKNTKVNLKATDEDFDLITNAEIVKVVSKFKRVSDALKSKIFSLMSQSLDGKRHETTREAKDLNRLKEEEYKKVKEEKTLGGFSKRIKFSQETQEKKLYLRAEEKFLLFVNKCIHLLTSKKPKINSYTRFGASIFMIAVADVLFLDPRYSVNDENKLKILSQGLSLLGHDESMVSLITKNRYDYPLRSEYQILFKMGTESMTFHLKHIQAQKPYENFVEAISLWEREEFMQKGINKFTSVVLVSLKHADRLVVNYGKTVFKELKELFSNLLRSTLQYYGGTLVSETKDYVYINFNDNIQCMDMIFALQNSVVSHNAQHPSIIFDIGIGIDLVCKEGEPSLGDLQIAEKALDISTHSQIIVSHTFLNYLTESYLKTLLYNNISENSEEEETFFKVEKIHIT